MKQLVTHWVRDDDNMIQNIKSIARGKPVLIIFDDAINSKSLPEIANLFMIDGRHSNMSMMFLTQRMFDKDKSFKDGLGQAFSASFIKLKMEEWHSYTSHFSEWEKRNTLDI